MTRALSSPHGGFIEGVAGTKNVPDDPGAYYRWTADDLETDVADVTVREVLKRRFGVEEYGRGGEIPHVSSSIDQIGGDLETSPSEVRALLAQGCDRLLAAREERSARCRDPRVCVGSNGVAIQSFAEGAIALNDAVLGERAERSCNSIIDQLWDGTEFVSKFSMNGEPVDHIPPTLDDYAHFGRGVLSCYEITGDENYRHVATAIAGHIERRYWDGRRLTLVPTESTSDLIVAPQVTVDRQSRGSIPASIDFLLALARIADQEEFADLAQTIFDQYAPRIRSDVLSHHGMALVGDRLQSSPTEIRFAVEEIPDQWRAWLSNRYFPHRLITHEVEGDSLGGNQSADTDPAPANGTALTIRINGVDSEPFTHASEADAWLKEFIET